MAVILFSLDTFFLLSVKFGGFTTFLIIPRLNRQIQSNAHFIEVFTMKMGVFFTLFYRFLYDNSRQYNGNAFPHS